MSDLKEQIKQLEAEAKAMQARQAQLVKTMRAGVKKANAVVEYAEKELKKAMRVRSQSTLVVFRGTQEKARLGGDTAADKIRAALKTAL